MKNDSKSCLPAEVDVLNARSSTGMDIGIEFSNEIDVWAKMQFRARHQIKQLKQFGKLTKGETDRNLHPLVYRTRQSIE